MPVRRRPLRRARIEGYNARRTPRMETVSQGATNDYKILVSVR